MELEHALNSRRSVRIFLDKPVEKEKLAVLIMAGNLAPSACNKQAWKFIMVDKDDLKNRLVDEGGSMVIKNAPTGILVLYHNQTLGSDYHDDIQSAAASIENILLKAVELGLGGCWICHLPPAKIIRKIFKIPENFTPVSYLLLGYPAKEPQNVPRQYSLAEIMNYNEFNQNWPKEKNNSSLLFFKKILVKIYYLSPAFIKKIFLNKLLDKRFVKKFEN